MSMNVDASGSKRKAWATVSADERKQKLGSIGLRDIHDRKPTLGVTIEERIAPKVLEAAQFLVEKKKRTLDEAYEGIPTGTEIKLSKKELVNAISRQRTMDMASAASTTAGASLTEKQTLDYWNRLAFLCHLPEGKNLDTMPDPVKAAWKTLATPIAFASWAVEGLPVGAQVQVAGAIEGRSKSLSENLRDYRQGHAPASVQLGTFGKGTAKVVGAKAKAKGKKGESAKPKVYGSASWWLERCTNLKGDMGAKFKSLWIADKKIWKTTDPEARKKLLNEEESRRFRAIKKAIVDFAASAEAKKAAAAEKDPTVLEQTQSAKIAAILSSDAMAPVQ